MSAARTDVAVVGGGVIGLCTAWYLQQAGRDVTVISRDPIGTGASAGNAGMIVPSHIVPLSAPGVIAQGLRWLTRRDAPFHLKPRLDLDLIRWLWQFRGHCTEEHVTRSIPVLKGLSLASVAAYETLAAELDFGYAPTGLLMTWRTEPVAQMLAHEADVARNAGLKADVLNAEELRSVQPHLKGPSEGGVLFPEDGRVDPDRLLAELLAGLKAGGARLITGREVARVEQSLISLKDTSTVQADHIVIAAGAWSPRLAPGLPIQPAKGYSVTVEAPAESPPVPMILMEDRVTVTLMPGKLRFGGTLSLSGYDASIDRQRLQPILTEAARYRPDVDAEQLPVWCGFRPASPDGLPMIGQVAPGVWVNSGHGMMGVSLAPASGQLAAALITGEHPPVDATPFSPQRFV